MSIRWSNRTQKSWTHFHTHPGDFIQLQKLMWGLQ
ncbi:hypothetical protein E2C01_050847 [Portunus trituberculatus]|uniref:Uncharacterized protein n=1 Tax=Portunus trituberculatus TaxID=210409 RepID=A0A5B7GA22_PORTR|nr:hypothetical protein [Portunus trituberculatus]